MARYTDNPKKLWQNDVVQMAMDGVRPRQIAEKLGRPTEQVQGVISYARSKGWDIPIFPTNICCGARKPKFAIKYRTYQALKPLAEARGITPNKLARAIVEHVVHDDLVDAVLDVGGAANG